MEEETKAQIQNLVNYSLDFSEHLLLNFEEFYPFAAKINRNNKLIPVGFSDNDEFPESQTVIDGLKDGLNVELDRTEIVVYSIAYDVSVKNEKYTNPIDAIAIRICHQKLESEIIYYYAYLKKSNKINFYDSWGEIRN
jgi:hypothetical protein